MWHLWHYQKYCFVYGPWLFGKTENSYTTYVNRVSGDSVEWFTQARFSLWQNETESSSLADKLLQSLSSSPESAGMILADSSIGSYFIISSFLRHKELECAMC